MKTLRVPLLCSLVLLGCPKKDEAPSPEEQKAEAEGTYIQATQAFMNGEYAQAHKLLDSVKLLNPKDPRLPAAEAEIFLAEVKLTDALAAFERAVKLDPTRATNYSRIGYIQALKGNKEAANAALAKALELNPNDFNALEALGDLQLKDGKLPEAVAAYLRAAEVCPDGVKAGLVIKAAQEQTKAGLADNALQTLNDAWKKNIKSPELLMDLGDKLVVKGRLPDAIAVYTDAAHLSADDPTIWELVGELEVRLDKPGNAEAAFRESLKIKDRGVVHVALARLCEKRKDEPCLKAEVDAALEKSTGEEPREMTELIGLLASVGRKDDAWKLLSGYANEEGNVGDGALQLKAAQLAKEVGDKAAVKEHCARVLASDAGVKKCP